MEKTPKSLRLQIGLFGRTNVGKSSVLNYFTGQDVAITSPVPGTTTDVVEKPMELLPLGPVLFLDTAGLDDDSELSGARIGKTLRIFERCDIAVLVLEADEWTAYEETVLDECRRRGVPCVAVVNKIDRRAPSADFLRALEERGLRPLACSTRDRAHRDEALVEFKRRIGEACPKDFFAPRALVSDLVQPGGLVVLVVPIDLEAPKGRLILPQVQVLRDVLDRGAASLVVKEHEYKIVLSKLKEPPALVVCDSQAVGQVAAETPPGVPLTTFSILFARFKGDLMELVRGVFAIDSLRDGDRVLIGEACTHHAVEDDIGRVKIPRWLRQYTGADLKIDVYSGFDYPADLGQYKLVIHCGGCMINRRQMMTRIRAADGQDVAITNYGVCISYLHGVLKRVLQPFRPGHEPYEMPGETAWRGAA